MGYYDKKTKQIDYTQKESAYDVEHFHTMIFVGSLVHFEGQRISIKTRQGEHIIGVLEVIEEDGSVSPHVYTAIIQTDLSKVELYVKNIIEFVKV